MSSEAIDYMTIGLTVGWFLGFCGAWVYFHYNKLIRSSTEWYAAKNGVKDDI
jgi:hypothetical protein